MSGLVEPGFVSSDADCAEVGFVVMRKFPPAEKLGVKRHNNGGEAHCHGADAHREIDPPADKHPSRRGNRN